MEPPNPLLTLHDPWFPHTRQIVKMQEVADATGYSVQAVRDLVDEGLLMALDVSADILNPHKERRHLRVVRLSVVAYMLNRLEDQGTPLAGYQEPHLVTWWRAELRKRVKVGGLKPLPPLKSPAR